MGYLRNAAVNLRRSRARTLITAGGIAIGILSVVVITCISDIGTRVVDSKLSGMGMDNVIVTASKNAASGLSEYDLHKLRTLESVDNAMPLMNTVAVCGKGNETADCMLWGVNEDAEQVIELSAISGRLINKGDVLGDARVCIIDEELADKLFMRRDITGKTISLDANGSLCEYEIVGVVKSGVNMLQSMLGDFIPSFVYIPYTAMSSQTGQSYFDNIAVRLTENNDEATGVIERRLLIGREDDKKFSVDNLLSQKEQLGGIMSAVSAVLTIIAGISLIIAGMSIMTVMLVSVSERTREIGIKKSIGAANFSIMLEFLAESVLLTLAGSIAGAAAGIGLTWLGCDAAGIAMTVNWGKIWSILLYSALSGVVFGVYPAFRAASMRPADALRTN